MISKIDVTKCTGCGICVSLCNMDVLRMDDKSNVAYIVYQEDCMTCFECALSCPETAIKVSYTPGFVPSSIDYAEGNGVNV